MNLKTLRGCCGRIILSTTILCIILSTASYGETNIPAFSIINSPFRYSHYYQDSETGLCYCKARYYSPQWMRFISRDTYDLQNRYTYCEENPITKTDPDGHLTERLLLYGAGFGAVMAAVGIILQETNNNNNEALTSISYGLLFTGCIITLWCLAPILLVPPTAVSRIRPIIRGMEMNSAAAVRAQRIQVVH